MPPTDAPDFYRWLFLCYDAGRADATGERLLEMDADDAAIVNIVRADWHTRMHEAPSLPPAPTWLAALQEQHEPTPWPD